MHRAETLDEADFLLTVTGATAFVSDVTFPDGTWRDALAMVAEVHPLTPLWWLPSRSTPNSCPTFTGAARAASYGNRLTSPPRSE